MMMKGAQPHNNLHMASSNRRSDHIRFLSQQIKGFYPILLLAIISKLLLKITPFAITFVLSLLISCVVTQSASGVMLYILWVSSLILMNVFFIFLDTYFSHEMSYAILTNLRNKLYRKIDEIAPGGISLQQSGDLVSTVLHDVEFFEWFYAHIIVEWITLALLSGVVLIFMASFSLLLPLVMLPFIGVVIFIPHLFKKRADMQGKEVRDKAGIVNSILIDGIQGVKDVISYQWEKPYFDLFSRASDNYQAADLEYARRSGQEKRCITACVELGSLLSMTVIVMLYLKGMIESVWILPLFTLSFTIFSPLQDAMSLSTNYGFVYGAAARVSAILTQQPPCEDKGTKTLKDVCDSASCGNSQGASCSISFKEVEFAYDGDEKAALSNVTFDVLPGQTVALVGASGCGKTTIVKLLQRFWDISQGHISINGYDIRDLTLETLRSLITVVTQDVYIFNGSIKENLLLAYPTATQHEIEAACEKAHILRFIQSLPQGFNTHIGEQGARLSAGQRQRIALAQAFLRNSPILILDEVTSNLDQENESEIIRSLEELKVDKTTLVISHRLSTIQQADHVYVIDEQTITDSGSFEDLSVKSKRFQELLKIELR